MKDRNGILIEVGHLVKTRTDKVYTVVSDNGILVLEGVKALSEVNVTPLIVGRV